MGSTRLCTRGLSSGSGLHRLCCSPSTLMNGQGAAAWEMQDGAFAAGRQRLPGVACQGSKAHWRTETLPLVLPIYKPDASRRWGASAAETFALARTRREKARKRATGRHVVRHAPNMHLRPATQFP